MIFLFFKATLKFFLKEEYPRWYGPILEFLAAILLLATLWFTSQAYSPEDFSRGDYFEYLLVGELVLHLPFSMLFQGVRVMKRIGLSGAADQLIVADKSILKMASAFLIVYFLKSSFRIILLFICAALFFKAPFALTHIPEFLLIIFVGVLPFTILSLALGCVVLFWGRGENIWGQISSWLSFLSGAYFPLSIFPDWLQRILPFVNPFSLYLETSRYILVSKSSEIPPDTGMIAFCWISLFLVALICAYRIGIQKYRNRGIPSSYSF